MNYRWISAGELARGQWVTVLGLRPQQKEVIIPTGEKVFITEEDKNPYIKGIPFLVENVQLPLVMLNNVLRVPNLPPLVFHDTRLVEFIEVTEEYAVLYKRHMYPDPPPQIQTPLGPDGKPMQIMLMTDGPEEGEGGEDDDPQGTFDFGDGTPPPDDGSPPLVPV